MPGIPPSAQNYEIRRATEEELPALQGLADYAFANNPAPGASEPSPLTADWSLCAFSGDQMVASSGGFPFALQMNGGVMAANGVTMVSTDPGHRRRGIVRRLIGGLLERAHEDDVPVSILWASMGGIYQRFGYGLASTAVEYSIEPRFVEFQFGEAPAGHTELLPQAEALPLCRDIYKRFVQDRTLMLKRSGLFWELMLKRQNDQNIHVAVYFDGAGEPAAYAFYQVRMVSTGNYADFEEMAIQDTAWTSMEGYRGIWSFLAGHDLVSRIRHRWVAEDDPGPDVLLNPRLLHRTTRDGVWMRVVDAAAALARRGYDLPGETVIGIADDVECPWNVGNWRLIAGDGEATVEATTAEPELRVSVQGLASLISGHRSASALCANGRLEASDPARLPAIDALFATRHRPSLLNMF